MKKIIEKELLTFSGQTFSNPKDAYTYVDKMLTRVAEQALQEERKRIIEVIYDLDISNKEYKYLLEKINK